MHLPTGLATQALRPGPECRRMGGALEKGPGNDAGALEAHEDVQINRSFTFQRCQTRARPSEK